MGTHPSDAQSWAVLGSAYVEWGQRASDAAYYARAEQALKRSLDVQPGERGNEAAWVGLASLANARHDYVTAKKWGETVRSRQPKQWTVYPELVDAYNGLGDYTSATKAVEKYAALRSGVPSLGLTAQMYRDRGWREDALATAQDAANRAKTPAEKAACLSRLGELAWERGEPEEAVAQYGAALRTDPAHHPALAGRARALAALGRTDEAQRDYQAALTKSPRPAYMLELGELYESLGLDGDSVNQYTQLRRALARTKARGVDDSLLLGRFEAAHGDAAAAVELLRAEWGRGHHSAAVADALGWALHRSGDPDSALEYAERAVDSGGQNASYAYHLGMVQRALKDFGPARRHLEEALRTNPQFSPLDAPRAQEALDTLGLPLAGGPQDMQPAAPPAPEPSQEPSPAAEPESGPVEPAAPPGSPLRLPARPLRHRRRVRRGRRPSRARRRPLPGARAVPHTLRRSRRPRSHRRAADAGSRHVPRRAGRMSGPPVAVLLRCGSTTDQRLPRFSCSRSIASNRALKLPFPKPIEPWRSIISKKTVGRSWTGLVKICSR